MESASTPLRPNTTPLNAPYFLDTPTSRRLTTPPFTPSTPRTHLETVQEKSAEGSLDHNDTVIETDVRFGLLRRKRKTTTTPDTSFTIKRKRDLTYSDSIKRTGSFFRTPLRYFSNRRRTIDSLSVSLNPDVSLNDSIASSSGLFNVDALNDLSRLSEITLTTPGGSTKKNFFSRTFSHARFNRKSKKPKMCDLDVTDRGLDSLNSSCFPDLPSLSLDHNESRVCSRTNAGTAGTAVLTYVTLK